MSETNGQASILIVDDKSENVVALEAILENLDQRIVRAYSGREALRHLLHGEFAVILLDVNMPDMDGFEAAAMIRQRPSSQHTPIIFITASGDEVHMARSYSLGAVDYIQTPVIPTVLRSKISVFIELFQKTSQVHRQSESLRRRATQLQKLSIASMGINSAVALDQMLKMVAESARDILEGHQCVAFFRSDTPASGRRAAIQSAVSYSDKYARWRDRECNVDSLATMMLAQKPGVTRLSDAELREHPDWDILRHAQLPPSHGGLLAAPLTHLDGRNLGLICVLERSVGSFNSEDEALLMQLGQITSIAIQNAIFAHERETNRLKDEFLATLSHELRTPLNAIVGWTQLLRMQKLPDEARHGMDVIDRNVKAQTKLIEDLLDVSRITVGKMRLNLRTILLEPVVRAAVEAIRPSADTKGIELQVQLSEDVQVHGDPDRLQQVAWNLLSNAIKFTPAGGRVQLKLEPINSHAQLSVSDTGQGIDPAFLPFVFDRFRQADSTTTRSHGGLGIGLTIVRHIIELHGGTVAAHSSGLGHGAAFTVTLPVSIPSLAGIGPRGPRISVPPPTMPSDGDPLKLKGKRILLVDDEADAREMLGEVLRRAEAEVSLAASVRQAFEFLSENVHDVIVSDIGLPEEDGYSLIRTLRQYAPERGGLTPAIALTAYARDEDRARVLKAGFQLHLAKPVEPYELIRAISSLAGNGKHMPREAVVEEEV